MIKTKRAKDVKVGDRIRFWFDSVHLVVEKIECMPSGMLAFKEGHVSATFWPLETVLVEDSDPKPEDYEDVGTYGVW